MGLCLSPPPASEGHLVAALSFPNQRPFSDISVFSFFIQLCENRFEMSPFNQVFGNPEEQNYMKSCWKI